MPCLEEAQALLWFKLQQIRTMAESRKIPQKLLRQRQRFCCCLMGEEVPKNSQKSGNFRAEEMGRKGSWFSALKKSLTLDPKENKDQKTHKSKKWFGKYKNEDAVSSCEETALVIPAPAPAPAPASTPTLLPPPTPPPKEDVELAEAEKAQNKHAYSVALATAVAAEAAVAAVQAAAEVVRLTAVPMPRYTGKSMQEAAAIKIQTAFRGHLARRALLALRGLVRLKSLIEGQSVKRQATTTLRCMQTVAHVQSQIRARRIRMSEENQALQRQLQQKQEKELEKFKASMGEDWNDSTESKEQVEAKLQMKQEAAVRRERALAYSFSHQKMWKNSPKYDHPTIMDPSNPHWGWSWLERWMAARPWESRSTAGFNDRASMRSAASRASMSVGEITKAYALRDKPFPRTPTALRSSRPSSRQSPSTPRSTAPLSASITRRTLRGNGRGGDEDSRSTLSIQSERFNRRFSMAGFSVRDHEGLASSPSVQSYRTPTKPTKARSRLATLNSNQPEKNGTPSEKGSVTSVKKQLSFAASPAGPRRHSGPLMYDSSSIKGTLVHARKCSR
ncbi:hypothetical protein ACFX1Q_001891 [Malus domestica]